MTAGTGAEAARAAPDGTSAGAAAEGAAGVTGSGTEANGPA
ncbi:hypothetical protein [Streptomyces sp. NPDC088762]